MEHEDKGRAARGGPKARAKVSSRLLRKARMVAAARGARVEDYLEAVLRPVLERDYNRMFDRGPEG